MILGIDEVGRGAWAGPLVVGACVLNGAEIEGLTDSKKLTKKQREVLNAEILASSAIVGLGWVEPSEIDEIGLSESLRLATKRAVQEVQAGCKTQNTTFDEIIIDGTVNFLRATPLEEYVSTLKKADLLIASVSAAAICAKVARDNFMAELDKELPDFNFGGHVGYGTQAHRRALVEFGANEYHRASFRPVAEILGVEITEADKVEIAAKTTKKLGDEAEAKVAEFLEAQNHEIVARNWRTRWCEIDIVSLLDGVYYFTEVKYRKNDDFGGSKYAINQMKLKQMAFAAEIFAFKNKLKNVDLRLSAALVDGEGEIDWFEIS